MCWNGQGTTRVYEFHEYNINIHNNNKECVTPRPCHLHLKLSFKAKKNFMETQIFHHAKR
jgi:hypothetical protein